MQFLAACKHVANTSSCCWARHLSLGVITIYPQVRAASYPNCCTQRLESSCCTQLLLGDWAESSRSPCAISQQGNKADKRAAITWANAKCPSCIYPSQKNTELFYGSLPSPERQQNFSPGDFFSVFLDYQARKIRHTYKTCQLENIVADSRELKILSS